MTTAFLTKDNFEELLLATLARDYGVEPSSATDEQLYRTLATITRETLSRKHHAFRARTFGSGSKQVYYLCMEFLMGRSLKNSLHNLGLDGAASAALAKHGIKLETIFEQEPDAGLGNGGLGRLAACYLDGMATEDLPGTGHCILYEYGIFRQKLVDGWQEELVDDWLPGGGVWLKGHPEEAVEVRFGGEIVEHWVDGYHHIQHVGYETVQAIPYNMYVSGYDSAGVSKLRLWNAKGPSFDMRSFNQGDFTGAIMRQSTAELISKVLYPNDNNLEGKLLRLKQQYFLAAASTADILNEHLRQYGDVSTLPDKVAIQLNDTHPTLAILELLRLLLDECGFGWDDALDICRRTFSYTNHTILSEALEKWDENLVRTALPRIYALVCELDRTAREDFFKAFPGDIGKVEYMAPISGGKVHMANICAYICHTINGVSSLHSDIIKQSVFNDFYLFTPEKFTNVTNGIAYRRWLLQGNEKLSTLIEGAIGPEFRKDATALTGLSKFADDKAFLGELADVKHANKERFAAQIHKMTGQVLNPDSIFDVQAKRLHEYKRQHLNALHILSEYLYLKENPNAPFTPKTYIFGAKAAPGYYMAKQIIRFICTLQKLLESDSAMHGKLQIVYLENYSVSLSEILMPASEISQQISLAGTEASGTGNMKFMINGAVTLGTLDGANVEISSCAGSENFIQFGMLTPQANAMAAAGYRPAPYIAASETVKNTLAFMQGGFMGETFPELFNDFTTGDRYMVMADFESYAAAQKRASEIYRDPEAFNKMCLANIAGAGLFSADRAVKEYAQNIWHMKGLK